MYPQSIKDRSEISRQPTCNLIREPVEKRQARLERGSCTQKKSETRSHHGWHDRV